MFATTTPYHFMKNLIHHFPTSYAYSVKKPIREVNLKRALDEDTGVFSSVLDAPLHIFAHFIYNSMWYYQYMHKRAVDMQFAKTFLLTYQSFTIYSRESFDEAD